MNLYLVFALALGAITGVVETPVMRPASLVAQRDSRVQRRIQQLVRTVVGRRSSVVGAVCPTTHDLRPTTLLNAAPRAPAFA
jgi:hypothetical protein